MQRIFQANEINRLYGFGCDSGGNSLDIADLAQFLLPLQAEIRFVQDMFDDSVTPSNLFLVSDRISKPSAHQPRSHACGAFVKQIQQTVFGITKQYCFNFKVAPTLGINLNKFLRILNAQAVDVGQLLTPHIDCILQQSAPAVG